MPEGFKNPYNSVKVELDGINDEGLHLKAPSPEALEEMFSGIGKIMPTTEQSTQSESEVLQAKVKELTDAIALLENADALESYQKLFDKLDDKRDTDTLDYYLTILKTQAGILSDLEPADPKRNRAQKLKSMVLSIELQVKKLRDEDVVNKSAVATGTIGSAIENL